MARPGKRGKPAAKKKASRIKEAIVLIPLTYNDGTAIPLKILDAIHEKIFLSFHGWTIEGTVKGAYRMASGQRRVEDLQKLSIILDEIQLPELEEMVAEWAATLGQETILLKVTQSVAKFIPPRTEPEEP